MPIRSHSPCAAYSSILDATVNLQKIKQQRMRARYGDKRVAEIMLCLLKLKRTVDSFVADNFGVSATLPTPDHSQQMESAAMIGIGADVC